MSDTQLDQKSKPMAEQVIRVIQVYVGRLEAEYANRLHDGPKSHLMGGVIDDITTLCRILDEINQMEEADADLEEESVAELREKLEDAEEHLKTKDQRMAELEKQFADRVRGLDELDDEDEILRSLE